MFFVSIFPLLLVAISVLGFVSAGNEDLATDIIDELNLSDAGALVSNEAEYIGYSGAGVFNQSGGTVNVR